MALPRRIPARTLVAVITAIALLPLVLLPWMGWRLLEQDRALAGQQVAQRMVRAADIVAAALERSVSASEQRLAAGAKDCSEGAVAVRLAEDRVEAVPRGSLAWLPVVAPLQQASPTIFAQGEESEFRKGNARCSRRRWTRLGRDGSSACRRRWGGPPSRRAESGWPCYGRAPLGSRRLISPP